MNSSPSASLEDMRVPDDLIERDQWVLWRYEARHGKPTKVPYQVAGDRADTTNPATWTTFEQALKGVPPFEVSHALPFAWSDENDIQFAAWLQHQGVCVSKDIAGQAVQTVAREHGFHPIREYLESLTWDGVRRIDVWLTKYLGANFTTYTRAVGTRCLISAVARVFRPGCKVDTCLILEGPQGALKSTALHVLAGDAFFSDDISELGSKDSVLQTRGVWIIELAELDAMSKSESSRTKAFMSRRVDRIRPPYGKRVIEVPRQCVFAGTINSDTYLKDETGGRRFWPVKCGGIHIDELRRDRNQLWAEAVELFRAGEPWWLETAELNATAATEQQARYEEDPWQPIIQGWVNGRQDVSAEEILDLCLGKPRKDWLQQDKNRIARSLKALCWKRFQKRIEGDEEKDREWRYRPASPVSPG